MQDWKAFHKSPTDFLKLGVLLNDQEQKVSPLEELFILRALERIQPRLTLKDIIGLEDQKKEIWPIINFVLNPNMYNATNTTIEKGVLLYGPTRTGKSLFAEAMAGTLETLGKELSFFKIKCSELRGIMGIDKILETIDKLPGVKIAFFDEMDLLNLQRDGDKTMLSDFLNNMGKHNIIIIGATNRIDHFDQALLQAGRFGKRIAFVNPPLHTRIEFFRDKLTKMNILDDSLDLQRLGIETDNCSFGDLESIVNDAVAKATQKKQTLAYHHFDAALDTFKRNITSLEIPLPEAERRLIATHLSGHAMAFELLPTSESLHKFTMLPIKKHILEEKVWLSDIQTPKKITYFGDVYTLHKTNTGGFDTFEQKINMVKVLLAGHVAEKVMLGSTSYSYHNEDNEKARAILEALVFKGIKKDNVSKKECNKKMEEVMALFDKYEQETTEFIIANKDKLVKMIDALLVRKTLTQEDVQKLIGLQPQQPMAAAAA
jgi:cell division protease FtsH